MVGGIIHINNQEVGGTDNVDSYFSGGTSMNTEYLNNDIYVRNTSATKLYSWKLNRMQSKSVSADGYNIKPNDSIVRVDTSSGNVTVGVYPGYMVDRHFYVKKVSGDNNTLSIGTNGGLIDNVAGPVNDNNAYASYHLYCDGTNFHILGKYP